MGNSNSSENETEIQEQDKNEQQSLFQGINAPLSNRICCD
jgi:hypothetical protein